MDQNDGQRQQKTSVWRSAVGWLHWFQPLHASGVTTPQRRVTYAAAEETKIAVTSLTATIISETVIGEYLRSQEPTTR